MLACTAWAMAGDADVSSPAVGTTPGDEDDVDLPTL